MSRKTDAEEIRRLAVEACIAVVLKYMANDYTAVRVLAELEKLK